MKTDSIEFGICPNCGSTEYIEDYPAAGERICVKCGHDNLKIKLKNTELPQEILNQCPFCGKEGEEDDTLFENDDMVILKCKKCGKLDGYRFSDYSAAGFEHSDEFYDTLTFKIAKQEGKFIHPASKYQEFAKALREREKSPVEKCKRQLNLFVHKKIREMNIAGVAYGTISRAKWKALSFIEKNGPLTNKQLKSLFSAALYLGQESELTCYGKTFGKRVTERQLEGIFDVTRKTIRKWKRILQ